MQFEVIAWSRSRKQLAVMTVDVLLSLLATWIAFSLRLDTPNIPTQLQLRVYLLAPCLPFQYSCALACTAPSFVIPVRQL